MNEVNDQTDFELNNAEFVEFIRTNIASEKCQQALSTVGSRNALRVGPRQYSARSLVLLAAALLLMFCTGFATGRTPRPDFNATVQRVAEIINNEGGVLVMAQDMPAYGDSKPAFALYEKALQKRIASKGETRIVWYSDADEQKYIKDKSKSDDPSFLANSRRIRALVEDVENVEVRECVYEKLDDFQFWVWTDGTNYKTVIAFVEKASVPAEVTCETFDSPEIGKLFMQMFSAVESHSKPSL